MKLRYPQSQNQRRDPLTLISVNESKTFNVETNMQHRNSKSMANNLYQWNKSNEAKKEKTFYKQWCPSSLPQNVLQPKTKLQRKIPNMQVLNEKKRILVLKSPAKRQNYYEKQNKKIS